MPLGRNALQLLIKSLNPLRFSLFQYFPRNIQRPRPYLVINTSKVLTDNTKKDQLNTAKKEHQDQRRSLPDNSAGEDTQNGGNEDTYQADSGQKEAEACRQF